MDEVSPIVPPIMASEDIQLDNLYPAIVECFAVILCGYVAGKLNVISDSGAKGLSTFVGTFALPSMIFTSMATLNFHSVNWLFLLAILLAKTIVFVAVLITTFLVTQPSSMSKSGLLAIFCTQSNDFALGYPIIVALYGKTQPDYPSYLYLLAPISLVILNPIGFLFMELGKRKEESPRIEMIGPAAPNCEHFSSPSLPSRKENGGIKLVCGIFLKVLLNPVVLMTTLGICGNFIFKDGLPVILEGILKVFGSAFSSTALFMLGLSMVGTVHKMKGANLVVPGILIAVKCLVLPLITRELVMTLQAGKDANETLELSNYAFLYGTFPSAPSVFVFSTQFNIDSALIASAMVACTFLSAPLMFISAKMVTLNDLNPMNYINELDSFLFNISIISLISTIWVITLFLLTKKWKKIPHYFTLCLVISQLLSCIGVILWSTLGCCDEQWQFYVQFTFITMGVFGSRIWTALLSLSLYFLRTKNLTAVLKLRPILTVIGWGIPILISVSVFASGTSTSDVQAMKTDPNFQFGRTQAIIAFAILTLSFIVTVTCLILQERHSKEYDQYQSLQTDESNQPDSSPEDSTVSVTDVEDLSGDASTSSVIFSSRDECRSESIDGRKRLCSERRSDLFSPTSEVASFDNCDSHQLDRNAEVVERYRTFRQLTEPEEVTLVRDRDDEYQTLRHVVLLLVLSCSMFVGMALCLWTLIMEQPSGIYLELLFLDGVLNYGQGFFVCMVFGFDTKLIVAPFMTKWRQFRLGAQSLVLPRWELLDPETRHICEQFYSYHMDKCIRDLVRDRRWRLKKYRSVFLGTELVDWLILVGLAHDRSQALRYGRYLLSGRLIRHIGNEYHFHDQPFFYTFQSIEHRNSS